jgi:hypothetical protein
VAVQRVVLLGGGSRGEWGMQRTMCLWAVALRGGWPRDGRSWAAEFGGDMAVRCNGRCC